MIKQTVPRSFSFPFKGKINNGLEKSRPAVVWTVNAIEAIKTCSFRAIFIGADQPRGEKSKNK